MGVDPKRPLVGFALVAVLCAVLMALSVGRGSASLDLLHPGRPIAAPAERTLVEPPAEAPAVAAAVSIPAELSPQPIGVVVAARAEQSTSVTAAVESETDYESTEQDDSRTNDPQGTTTTEKAARKADRAVDRAARKADRAAEKAARAADRLADKLARATVKAADKQADKAARKG